MIVLQEPSNKQTPIRGIKVVKMLCSATNEELMKRRKEPESIRVHGEMGHGERDRVTERDCGSEKVDTLRQTNLAMQVRSTQPSDRAAYS